MIRMMTGMTTGREVRPLKGVVDNDETMETKSAYCQTNKMA